MSLTAHPNIHAVGMEVEIIKAIEFYRRGNAASVPFAQLMEIVNPLVIQFCVELSEVLDERYGVPKNAES